MPDHPARDRDATSRWRRAATATRPVAIGMLVAVALELAAGTGTPVWLAAAYGAVLGSGFRAWERLAARLGPMTALAAMCAVCGAVFGTLGLLGAALGGLCDGCVVGPAIGFMLLVGVSVPLLAATAIGPAVWLTRRAPSVGRWVRAQLDR